MRPQFIVFQNINDASGGMLHTDVSSEELVNPTSKRDT